MDASDRPRFPPRGVMSVIALLVLAAILLLRWLDEDDDRRRARRAAARRLRRTVEIHYKLAPVRPALRRAAAVHAPARDPWPRSDDPRAAGDALRSRAVVPARCPRLARAESAGRAGVRGAGIRCRTGRGATRRRQLSESTRRLRGVRATSAPRPRHRCAGGMAARRARAGRLVRRRRGRLERQARGPARRAHHARRGPPDRRPMWRAHGTAVLGEVVGRDNGKGVVGLAPDVERVFTSSIGGSSVADALDAAAERCAPATCC